MTAGIAASLLAVFVLTSLAWAAIGTAASIVLPTGDVAFPILGLSTFPLLVLSGAFGTISSLPSAVTTILRYLPGQPAADAATHVLRHTGGGLAPIAPRDVAVLAGWAVAGLLVSIRFFRWDPRRPSHARRSARDAAPPPAHEVADRPPAHEEMGLLCPRCGAAAHSRRDGPAFCARSYGPAYRPRCGGLAMRTAVTP